MNHHEFSAGIIVSTISNGTLPLEVANGDLKWGYKDTGSVCALSCLGAIARTEAQLPRTRRKYTTGGEA